MRQAIVVLRADASHDCASENVSSHEEFVPPLVTGLFDRRYEEILHAYPPAANSVAGEHSGRNQLGVRSLSRHTSAMNFSTRSMSIFAERSPQSRYTSSTCCSRSAAATRRSRTTMTA